MAKKNGQLGIGIPNQMTRHTIKEQHNYNCKRSKKGTLDRNGKPLSDFMRGVYLGKAKGIGAMAKMHKKYSNKNK